jgi:ATP-binding cassette subfamily F protein uup
MEAEQAGLTARLADPALYQRDPGTARTVKERLVALEREHALAFARWEELEAAAAAAGRA